MASNSFGSQKVLDGMVYRSGPAGRMDRDLRSDIDAAFVTLEASVAAASSDLNAAEVDIDDLEATQEASGAVATATLIFTGLPVATNTLTIGADVYEFQAAAAALAD